MAERFSEEGQKRQRQKVMGSQIKIRKVMCWWLVIIMVMVGMMDNGVRECNAQWISYFECAWECYLVEGAIQQLLCLADCMKRCTWRTRKCKAGTFTFIRNFHFLRIQIYYTFIF